MHKHRLPLLVDTHCHLDMSQFDSDREAVIQRALDTGLNSLITIGSDEQSSAAALALAEANEAIYCSIGFHPHDAKDFTEEGFLKLKEMASRGKVVAVGETGLDYHYDHSPREVQREVMRRHLELAMELGLPAIIHSREAEDDTLSILRASGINKGVMHCFSGGEALAEAVLSMGLHISIAGPVTFKKSATLKKIAQLVPDDRLLIETDSPYLAPEPMRGKRNEPAFIVHTAREIASLRGVSFEDVARVTSLNAARLFGIGGLPGKGEISYRIRNSLYLNVTNRCTNTCSFCVRFASDFVKGHNLRLAKGEEPSVDELKAAIGDPKAYSEVVFCGYGEPLIRLDEVIELSKWIKARGGRVRVNTNGHGSLIHKRNILPELKGLVDAFSISLNAHDEATYERLCRPAFKNAFGGVLDFIREAVKYVPEVQVTVVDTGGVDLDRCRRIAEELSVKLRIRALDTVG